MKRCEWEIGLRQHPFRYFTRLLTTDQLVRTCFQMQNIRFHASTVQHSCSDLAMISTVVHSIKRIEKINTDGSCYPLRRIVRHRRGSFAKLLIKA
ncbi:hypothetical protein T4B_14599 [Trichinella pseudospiralis]|uniref:Uncharacterized protein n=1 Tax=Trichinella pseudospiralis TaxID=6337 RepID=A0A0V1JH97_TRIPS|nr:hypothetical protein T4A_7261 [Trichinella pseudospiralis]KRZ34376.1 hypothetical protein T4B_14599 [Trichinella pseudospiralis]KRZ45682.1 hypothetical protein T4C_7148 [Trichinella pseudospiralis]